MADGVKVASENGTRTWFWGRYSRLGLWTAVVTLVLDQAHKWWMILGLGMREGDRFALMPFLEIIYVKNTGISYSLFDSASWQWQYALAGFAIIVSAALWVWLARSGTGWLIAVSLGLIIGGAVGNGIDRVLLGGVADFFLLHAFGYSWYVFNIADVAIVAGVAGLLYDLVIASCNDDIKSS